MNVLGSFTGTAFDMAEELCRLYSQNLLYQQKNDILSQHIGSKSLTNSAKLSILCQLEGKDLEEPANMLEILMMLKNFINSSSIETISNE